MSHKKLAEIVVRSIEYFELVDDDQLDPHTALRHLEDIATDLAQATSEEQEAVRQAARERLAWFLHGPDEYGYTPRKMLSAERRRLLEDIASGDAFGLSGGGTE